MRRSRSLRSLVAVIAGASLLLGLAGTAEAGHNWTRAVTDDAARAGQRPWSIYGVKIDGAKHLLGVTNNAPAKLRARIRQRVASDPVAQTMIVHRPKAGGAERRGRVLTYGCYAECTFTFDHPPAFDFPAGCGDVIVYVYSSTAGWAGRFNTWSHWCAIGFTIGNTPRLYTSQDSSYNAVPVGTNNNINPFFYNWLGYGPQSGYHVGAQGYWIACTTGCRYWTARIEHYMHFDGSEYVHMYPAR